MSNDDILGDEIPYYQEEAYRQFCYKMLLMNVGVGISKCPFVIIPSFCSFPLYLLPGLNFSDPGERMYAIPRFAPCILRQV